jgi:spore coat protein U-like protein
MCAGDTDGAGHFMGTGCTTAEALGIRIKVLAANAQAAMAHADYLDTVTLTLSY